VTESIRGAAKRQESEGPARGVVEYDPAPDVAYPVRAIAGLALPGPLHSGHLATASAAAPPISVVDALRRQAIRRSSAAASMNLGNDHDDDSEMEEEEQKQEEEEEASWEGTAEKAGEMLVRWLGEKAGGGTNYTVAVCSGDIYIGKVSGVTKKAALMEELKTYITEKGIEVKWNILLCKSFNTSLGSNHAEMCVLAAIGEKELGKITFFKCTSKSCVYCAETLRHYRVTNSSPVGEAATQVGWAHPFKPIAFGSQMGGDKAAQVAELRAYHADTGAKLTIGKTIGTAPSGRCEKWLSSTS